MPTALCILYPRTKACAKRPMLPHTCTSRPAFFLPSRRTAFSLPRNDGWDVVSEFGSLSPTRFSATVPGPNGTVWGPPYGVGRPPNMAEACWTTDEVTH
eukprot:4474705-Prymnesium_polylepis.1